MTRRRERGYTMIEVIITLVIFGGFLFILVILTTEMRSYDKRLPVDFMTHPQVSAVVSRLRKDVQSASEPYYPDGYEDYEQTDKTLILYVLQESGFGHTVVWDFSTDGTAVRLAFSAGEMVSEWKATGLPKIEIDSVTAPNSPDAVRLVGYDGRDRLAIDLHLHPRPHPNLSSPPPTDTGGSGGS